MSSDAQPIAVLSSPHIKGGLSTETIMRHVIYALVPVVAISVLMFGLSALLLVTVTPLTCVAAEWFFCRVSGKESTLGDCSAVVTGMLLALTLPPGLPLWMAVVGGVISIGLGKTLFGGLGFNVFNPALVGRAFLQTAFPVALTTWTPPAAVGRFTTCIPSTLAWPFMTPPPVDEYVERAAVDGFSGATALSLMKFGDPAEAPDALQLFTGTVAGSVGETSAVVVLVCGVYLAARKMLDWRIPVGVLGSVFVVTTIFHLFDPQTYPPPLFMLLAGGLMLGSVFMATDMVTSPVTPAGVWIYGAIIGVVTALIRLTGSLPEGLVYAILLGNAMVPLLNHATQPRIHGGKRKGEHLANLAAKVRRVARIGGGERTEERRS
ncbi:MAG: RnfABCDGE type electron transport complex subunit D [Planctomycetota bacterium]